MHAALPRTTIRWLAPLALLLLALLCATILALCLGSVRIPPGEVLRILVGATPLDPAWRTIVLEFRLPRCLTALVAGAALACAGLQMQTIFRNPLAGPYVLGINAGASLGVALVLLGTAGGALSGGLSGALRELGAAGAAIAGAGGMLALVLVVARRVEDNVSLLIVGLMFGYAASACVSVLLHWSEAHSVQSFVVWSFGSFGGVDRARLRLFAALVALGLVLAIPTLKSMNALLLGETYAHSLGVPVARTRGLVLASASVLAGAVTAYCGPVAFLGVAVPHLCRGLLGTADHRILGPAVLLMGATLAQVADLLAQAPGHPSSLPLNAVTAFIGAPVVIAVVLRQRRFGGAA